MTTKQGIITLIACTVLSSCAGPMTPFGALGLDHQVVHQQSEKGQDRKIASTEESLILSNQLKDSRAQVIFKPGRQRLYDQQKFMVTITDPDGILPVSKLRIYYNEIDVTESFQKRTKSQLSSDHQTLNLVFDFLRLPSQKNHHIAVKYQRDIFTKSVWEKFLPPFCISQEQTKLGDLTRFNVEKNILRMIENETKAFQYNPNFLAGLIAQESGFNKKAVSRARAIGLTQMTNVAAREISETSQKWPHYPEIEQISFIKLKYLISTGAINSKNEWRLDDQKSIIGGLTYLKYVDSYWSSQKTLLSQILPDYQDYWEDLLLASYNSGPARVKGALLNMGSHFLDHDELGEARKYVSRVKSYCYDFAQKSEDI